MKILIINRVYGVGSTGKIVKQLASKAAEAGMACTVAHRYEEKGTVYPENVIAVSSWWDCHVHNRLSRLTMLQGVFSRLKTRRFIKKVKKLSPDIIHLHNVHGSFINHKMLFKYIKDSGVKVIWTLHDCWPLTGNCKYFDLAQCQRWQGGCGSCPQKGESFVDLSAKMYIRKQKQFMGIKDLTIVTPSRWLAELVRKSPLGCYPVRVINNGIDLSVFTPTESDFKEKHGIQNKKIVLGVAFDWGERKGLDVFIRLAKRLPEDYALVMVGTNGEIDKTLPGRIISIHKTANQRELAAIYTAASVFVNPTREDNYPTVNMESIACGTPVITFRTGGSPEMLSADCGAVVDREDLDGLEREIYRLTAIDCRDACLKRAAAFDKEERFEEYVRLYREQGEK